MSDEITWPLVLGFLFGFIAGILLWHRLWRRAAAERGAGEYDARTGEWRWREPEPSPSNDGDAMTRPARGEGRK